MIPREPPLSVLDTTALIDQAEIFITGDTGTMHLAVAFKRLSRRRKRLFSEEFEKSDRFIWRH